jgi:hypothetical protein
MTLTSVLLVLLLALAFFAVSTGAVMFLIVCLPGDHFCRPDCTATRPGGHPVARWAVWIAKNVAGVLTALVGIVLTLPGVPGPGLVVVLLGVAMIDFPGKRRLERKLIGQPRVARTLNSLRARFGKPPLVFEAGPAEARGGKPLQEKKE